MDDRQPSGGRALGSDRSERNEGGSRLIRAVARQGREVSFSIDGRAAGAVEGDSLLVAILTNEGGVLRRHEATGEPRAGFCLMGACQDCWVQLSDASRVRSCTTPVREGMAVLTRPEADHG